MWVIYSNQYPHRSPFSHQCYDKQGDVEDLFLARILTGYQEKKKKKEQNKKFEPFQIINYSM
jgi:hypothetical protein